MSVFQRFSNNEIMIKRLEAEEAAETGIVEEEIEVKQECMAGVRTVEREAVHQGEG